MPELHTTKPEPKRHDFAAGETGRGPSVPSNGLANDPKAGQWDGLRMSKRMIADYKTFIVTDGEGVRNSLYVSGCPFHCVDCFNASIWDFQAGHEYTQKLEDKIIEDLKAPWVQGITFLGGEPFLNTPVLVPLAQRIRQEFGHTKDIWSWTSYAWEELMRPGETPDKLELLHLIDILVDGRYLRDQKDSLLQFRGSRNQRGILPDGLFQLGGVYQALRGDGQVGDLKALLFQRLGAVQNGMVLECGGDEVLFALGGPAAHAALQRPVIGLGAAGGKVDLARLGIQGGGHLAAGLFHGGTGGAPDGINAAGVAVVLHQPGGHGLQHCRRDRSGGGVIGVNKALFHSDTLPLSI